MVAFSLAADRVARVGRPRRFYLAVFFPGVLPVTDRVSNLIMNDLRQQLGGFSRQAKVHGMSADRQRRLRGRRKMVNVIARIKLCRAHDNAGILDRIF